MIRTVFIAIIALFSLFAHAQYVEHPRLPIVQLLQYQLAKTKHAAPVPFSRWGFNRMHIFDEEDIAVWGYHVHARNDFDPTSEPRFRSIRKQSESSMAIINEHHGSITVVFWSKQIYRYYAREINKLGFVMVPKANTNILQFRRNDTSVAVDIAIWSDCYVMTVI
jgi:hypothetical protein